MGVDFSSVRNYNEQAVCDRVLALAPGFPFLAHDAELLADVACVALNRLPPRYIRHEVDFAFYLTETERESIDRRVDEAVDFGFQFVQARVALHARR